MDEDNLKILIADDEMHIRLIIKAYFAPYKVEVYEAKDGKETMGILKENNIHLLILDNAMPLMTGQEVINQMLLDDRLKKIPVITYTAGGFDRETENRLKASSTAFIEKANIGDDLLPTVKDILGHSLKKK